MTDQKQIDAKAFGRAAFKANKDAIPIHDRGLMLLINTMSLAASEPIMRAWMTGWNEAKLEAQSV